MTRDQFIADNRIEEVLSSRGVRLAGGGDERSSKCPFHEDRNASMSVNVIKGTWFCHAGCGGGSVIDLLAKFSGVSPLDYIKSQGIGSEPRKAPSVSTAKPEIETIYSYTDALGGELFQVVRMRPKTFRQRHSQGGAWVWNMDGVERVLYRLPEVLKAQTVWVVEGEKDADNLARLGITATCNVGGAGKWLDGYTETLSGKDVVICGDNDKAGKEHVEKVFDSIAGKVKSARLVVLPQQFKDVSDYIASCGPEAGKKIEALKEEATPFIKGIKLPLFTMAELESKYQLQVRSSSETMLDLGKWLPSLGRRIRPLVPGELVLLLGDTGTGKSALLQNIALSAAPIKTLFFELELPAELMFERFVAIKSKQACSFIEEAYRTEMDSFGPDFLEKAFPHLFICTESRMSLEQLETYITRSELKIGVKPKLVCLDYVQLISGQGKRYERTSDTAEGLKVIAKSTGTIIVMASQVTRSQDENPEVSLHSGKDSGALENSAGLVLGAWRDPEDKTLLHLKVLKNTKGTGGIQIECNFDGEKMLITERAQEYDEEAAGNR